MIVDSHAYCFEGADSPAGHKDVATHLKYVQWSYALHHQPAWRVRDRAPASSAVLLSPTRDDPWRIAQDVDFRIDRELGRMTWTVDGDDFTKQSFPPGLMGLAFGPGSLIAEMDYAGVDVALLHTDQMLGRDTRYLSDCVRRYPDRLRSMAPVDEWRIPTETDAVIAEVVDTIQDKGLHAIKFIPEYAYRASFSPWRDPAFTEFWDAVALLGVPVFFGLSTGAGDQRQGYLSELRHLMNWMDRYPDMRCSLTHGFPYRSFLDDSGLNFPAQVWEPFANKNLTMEISFPVRLGDLFDFPYRELLPAMQEMVERIGADHLMWGTDMPFQNRFCTYRQSRQWIERYCDFLSPSDVADIMGRTASRVLGL